ncbi:uncharacterized protein LOC122262892 [Penaeus japonicus]|uniref:uncharacterized protein LOC122262892 n=1 Tax=Penaeus japonicus TaxID=27405 RepID=UPI001C70EAD8|nr:uncharacterized protein LOC122262892 [Penaeus japonicus]
MARQRRRAEGKARLAQYKAYFWAWCSVCECVFSVMEQTVVEIFTELRAILRSLHNEAKCVNIVYRSHTWRDLKDVNRKRNMCGVSASNEIPGSKAPPEPARTRPDPGGPKTRSMTWNQKHMTQGNKLDPRLVAAGTLSPGEDLEVTCACFYLFFFYFIIYRALWIFLSSLLI